eukprot:GFKZ01009694.1.p1 GENE.GFKZ01009694.1~~GFKZ01009694.1.p1  ORF type:complete len:370 (+),score=1.72 GFKZ01009694.1:161-1111(+)
MPPKHHLMLLLFVLVPRLHATLPPPLTRQQVPLCGSFCRFSMCSANATLPRLRPAPFVILGPPLVPSNRFICQRGANPLITILSTSDPQIQLPNNTLTPLSTYRPPNLTPRFPPRFLRTALLRPGSRALYGVTSLPPRGNQWSFLHDRCFVLPITRYRIQNPDQPAQFQTIDASQQRDSCVAFRTRAPLLHVQLTWESNGDGDILVQGPPPSRTTIDFLNPRPNARSRLVGDNGQDTCNDATFPGYTENVVYFPGSTLPQGEWVAEAWQAGDCGRRGARTPWSLSVVRDGLVSSVTEGVAVSRGEYQKAGVLRFTI